MDGLLPSERPVSNPRQTRGRAGSPAKVDQPPQPAEANWLNDFLRREGIVDGRGSPPEPEPVQEPAKKSYRGRAVIAVLVALALVLGGVVAFHRIKLGYYAHRAEAAVAAITKPAPAPAHPPAPPAVAVTTPRVTAPLPKPAAVALGTPAPAPVVQHPNDAPPDPVGKDAMAFSNFPEQPIDEPPAVMSHWAAPPVMPPSLATPQLGTPRKIAAIATPPKIAAIATPPKIAAIAAPPAPHVMPPEPHVPLPAPQAVPPAPLLPTAPPLAIAPAPQAAPPTAPAVRPVLERLAAGTLIQLRIVYTPYDTADQVRIDMLTSKLRNQINEIGSVTSSPGSVKTESVVYFFSNDRADASRVAASLARMTRRAVPVRLVHADPLPRPGTVEIRLPQNWKGIDQ
jgi:hypothetical protein